MSTQSVLRRVGLRAAAIIAASTLVLVGVANSASAHVTVSSGGSDTLARVLGGAGLLLGLIGLGLRLRPRTAKP
jgi:hypothetical protein